VEIAGADLMNKLRDLSIRIYSEARTYAAANGIIIADTKFEFGLPAGSSEPILIDEVLTPDSSRFWPADKYQIGQEQPSLDKQYVRNYLESLVAAGKWNKQPPGPTLPDDVIANTLTLYQQACRSLTGHAIAL
jgi:phosphoribosylaminoimidazole-succinocarboxamide synthase